MVRFRGPGAPFFSKPLALDDVSQPFLRGDWWKNGMELSHTDEAQTNHVNTTDRTEKQESDGTGSRGSFFEFSIIRFASVAEMNEWPSSTC